MFYNTWLYFGIHSIKLKWKKSSTMKCYTLKDKECVEGIDVRLIPVTPALLSSAKDNIVTDAIVVPSTKERDDLSFEAIFKAGLHCATAICSIVFDKAGEEGSDRILVAYNPTELFPSREGGDSTDIVYRNRYCFVAVCKKGEMVFRKISRKTDDDKFQFEYRGEKPETFPIPQKTKQLPDEEDSSNFIIEIK